MSLGASRSRCLLARLSLLLQKPKEEGSFEVEYGEGEIIVWAWSSAIAEVICDGTELGGLAGKKCPAVPAMPVGRSVSSFLRFMLGKEIKKGGN